MGALRDQPSVICGATGSGKTFVACALAHQACRQKQAVLYRRVPELIAELARVRDTARHDRLMRRLVKCNLLVLDDWGLQDFSTEGRRELMEIVEQRHERRSTLVASQIPVEHWPKVIGDRRAWPAAPPRCAWRARPRPPG